MANMERQHLSIAFVVGKFYAEGSGVTQSIVELSRELTKRGHNVTVFSPSYKGREAKGYLLDTKVRLVSAPGFWCYGLGVSPKLKQTLANELSAFDIVHTHSLWMLPTHYATRIAEKYGIPTVVSVQGCLDPWAKHHSGWKKVLASWSFQRSDIQRAAVIHAVTRMELRCIKSYAKAQAVAVIPNGIPQEVVEGKGNKEAFISQYPELHGARIIMFMSRLHIKKGLDILVDAWRHVCRETVDWKLVIIGPDDGYGAAVRRLITDSGIADRTFVFPPCYGQAKYDALAAADCFILPSRSEGLPIALLEAMGAGKPVVFTTGCCFSEAATCGAGYEIPCDAISLAGAIRRMTQLSAESLAAMGKRGKELVERDYLWPNVTEKFVKLYRWLRDGKRAPPPPMVAEI